MSVCRDLGVSAVISAGLFRAVRSRANAGGCGGRSETDQAEQGAAMATAAMLPALALMSVRLRRLILYWARCHCGSRSRRARARITIATMVAVIRQHRRNPMTDPDMPRRVTEHHAQRRARSGMPLWQPLLVLAVLIVVVILGEHLGLL